MPVARCPVRKRLYGFYMFTISDSGRRGISQITVESRVIDKLAKGDIALADKRFPKTKATIVHSYN